MNERPRAIFHAELAPKGYPVEPHDLDQAIYVFHKMKVGDPLMFLATELNRRFAEVQSLLRRASKADWDSPELNTRRNVKSALDGFSGFVAKARFGYYYHEQSGLTQLMRNVATIQFSYDTLKDGFASYPEIPHPVRVATDYVMLETKSTLDAVLEGLAAVTPEKLMLQSHLEHLVLIGMPASGGDEVKRAEILYGTLCELRDSYFASPKPGLLHEYLKEATLVEASSEYRRFEAQAVMSNMKLRGGALDGFEHVADRLADYTLSLEALALLEHTDS